MSDLHTTATPDAAAPPSAPQNNLAAEFKKLIPMLLISALTAGATSWYNTQRSQVDLSNRLEKLEEKAETNAKNIAHNSEVLQNNAIRIAEIGIIQQNTLEQVKDLKQEQNEIKSLLRK